MSNHISAAKGQIAESVLMPGDPLRAKFIAENFLESPKLYNEIRGMFGYTGTYKGVPVSIQGSGMGMPSMGIYAHELINEYQVQNIIRIGTAGSFHENIHIEDIVIGISASTDSDFAHIFDLDGKYSPTASWDLIMKAKAAADALGISVHGGNLLSSDVFYKVDPDWWKKWKQIGVMGVEMEAAALYMLAAWHGIKALAIVTISDHFVTQERSTAEERQHSFTGMMKIALEAVTS